MEKSLLYRIILVAVIVVVGLFTLIPTVFYDYGNNKTLLPEWWGTSKVLPQGHMALGLDLQGGIDMVVSVDAQSALVSELRHDQDLIQEVFKDKKIGLSRVETDAANKQLSVEFPDADNMKKGVQYINERFPELQIASGRDTLNPVYSFREAAAKKLVTTSIDQVKEVLTRRVDSMGLKEPEIVIQGANRVRVMCPGFSDPERLEATVKRTASLDFMLVEAMGQSKEAGEKETGKAPAGSVLASWTDQTSSTPKTVECYLPDSGGVKAGAIPANRRLVLGSKKTGDTEKEACYLLREDTAVSGSDLKDARPGYDPAQFNASIVNFEFNMKGAQKFAKITGENQGKQLAVVLEGKVYSAPVIRSKIQSRGQIEGSFTPQEATDLANVLRSGALNVGINIEETRTVGASLGADSIRKGTQAAMVGSIAVVIFMIVYYSAGGLIANLALILNVIIIMSFMSISGGTLTLPGLAGIVLTVGMSVDANVLIFERAREELRNGKTPHSAIDAGYAKALWTIIDSNVTTLIGALVLFQWGSGSVKGFALTLTVGLMASVFTSVVVTHLIYDLLFWWKKDIHLSIGIKNPLPAGSK